MYCTLYEVDSMEISDFTRIDGFASKKIKIIDKSNNIYTLIIHSYDIEKEIATSTKNPQILEK